MEPLGDLSLESVVPPIRSSDTLKDALLAMVAFGRPALPVINGEGTRRGQISLHGLQRVVADRAGHAMHTALVSRLLRDHTLWEEIVSDDEAAENEAAFHSAPARPPV